jgi:hypothetical protein
VTPTRADVDVRESLTPDEFYRDYVNKKPVVMRGGIKGLPAVSRWSIDYFRSIAPDLQVRVKTGNMADGGTSTKTLSEYCDMVEQLAAMNGSAGQAAGPIPYLHDFPLLRLIPALRNDLEPFPRDLFPKFFRTEWWTFCQVFVSAPHAATPFHFDTLLTHNLFFQVHGDKRFVMAPAEDRPYCYTYKWRWSAVDPDNPDFARHPEFRKARVVECVLHGGDILYMPPGTLHQVTSVTQSISFNIDWHDKVSAIRGMAAVGNGMPAQNLKYNSAFAMGILTGVPYRVVSPVLDSYYYYIS